MKISYPEDFATTVRREFEDRADVIGLLDRGDCALRRVLAEEAAQRVEPKEVVRAFGDGKPDALLSKAESILRRAAIYRSWLQVAMDSLEPEEESRDAGLNRATGV